METTDYNTKLQLPFPRFVFGQILSYLSLDDLQSVRLTSKKMLERIDRSVWPIIRKYHLGNKFGRPEVPGLNALTVGRQISLLRGISPLPTEELEFWVQENARGMDFSRSKEYEDETALLCELASGYCTIQSSEDHKFLEDSSGYLVRQSRVEGCLTIRWKVSEHHQLLGERFVIRPTELGLYSPRLKGVVARTSGELLDLLAGYPKDDFWTIPRPVTRRLPESENDFLSRFLPAVPGIRCQSPEITFSNNFLSQLKNMGHWDKNLKAARERISNDVIGAYLLHGTDTDGVQAITLKDANGTVVTTLVNINLDTGVIYEAFGDTVFASNIKELETAISNLVNAKRRGKRKEMHTTVCRSKRPRKK